MAPDAEPGGPTGSAARPSTTRRVAVTQFVLLNVLALVVLLVGATFASRSAGTDEAIRDVRSRTELLAHSVVEPALPPNLVSGDPAAVELLDILVRERVLMEPVTRVKIWSRDGTIVYSDEARLVGSRYPLGDEELDVFTAAETGQGVAAEAEVSDLSKPENRYERGDGKLLEVYLPIRAADGEPLLFEAYFRYDEVSSSAGRIWAAFAPILVGTLVLLALVQVPLAWRLASRIVRTQQEREGLLRAAVDASDRERRRIASDLHDGVVQDLTGLGYSLSALGERLATAGHDSASREVEQAAGHTRTTVRALRSLLVEIYPPNLHQAGIENALADLLASLAGRGVETSLDVGSPMDLDRDVEAMVFRAAQEGLRNVARHARATHVRVELRSVGHLAVLTVADDGVGPTVPPAGDDAAEDGHVGLALLGSLAQEMGGRLRVDAPVSGGTILTLEVPLR